MLKRGFCSTRALRIARRVSCLEPRVHTPNPAPYQCAYASSRPSPRVNHRKPGTLPPKARLVDRAQGTEKSDSITSGDYSATEEGLFPRFLLESAKASGEVKYHPEDAYRFLKAYSDQLGAQKGQIKPESVQKLCNDHGIEIRDLTTLAQILLRGGKKPTFSLARSLLQSGSTLGDPSATFFVVRQALKSSAATLKRIGISLQHLSTLAMDGDPEALYLLGMVDQEELKFPSALNNFEKAEKALDNVDGDTRMLQSELFVALGRLRLKMGERVKAETSLRRATALDDGTAFHHLAGLQPPLSSERYTYLLKGASAGITESAHELGQFYLRSIDQKHNNLGEEIQDGIFLNTEEDDLKSMAIEWLTVSATGGYTQSQLDLATLLISERRFQEAMEWIEKAQEDPSVATAISDLKEEYELKRRSAAG
ncbi:MAG: hypothetical protein M4579_000024 [Chaenotheca gracillima]|nr:MAG: hypothetical protein M4579_000024 [Chaenotheca gracillima]